MSGITTTVSATTLAFLYKKEVAESKEAAETLLIRGRREEGDASGLDEHGNSRPSSWFDVHGRRLEGALTISELYFPLAHICINELGYIYAALEPGNFKSCIRTSGKIPERTPIARVHVDSAVAERIVKIAPMMGFPAVKNVPLAIEAGLVGSSKI